MGQTTPRFVSIQSRIFGRPAWIVTTYILNGLLFLLMGLYLPEIVQGLRGDSLWHALGSAVVIFGVMVLARLLFGEISIRVIRLLDRRPSQKTRRTIFAERMVNTVAGFRGAISIAVAFSIPLDVANRDVVIFITTAVVILSLTVQGSLMQPVVRWAQGKENPWRPKTERSPEAEVSQAFSMAAKRMLPQLDELGAQTQAQPELVAEYRQHLQEILARQEDDPAQDIRARQPEEVAFRLAVLRQKRAIMVQLRDERKIDDETLIYIFELLDIEELSLLGPVSAE